MLRFVFAASFAFMITGVQAQEFATSTVPERPAQFDQVIYKGLAGNFLETLPIEADERVKLQRANAVISSPMTGRSLALLLGVSGPAFIVGGLIWGIWAALHIEAPKPDTSWLGAPERHGLGFCSDASSRSCRIYLRHETIASAGPTF